MPRDGGRPIQKLRRVRSFGTRNFLQFCRGSCRAFPTASGHLARRRGPLLFMPLPARKFCLIRIAPHVTSFLKDLIAPAVQSFSFAKNLFANHRAHFDHCAWRSIWAVASIGETPCHAQPKKSMRMQEQWRPRCLSRSASVRHFFAKGRLQECALFSVAIDLHLRGSDLLALRVEALSWFQPHPPAHAKGYGAQFFLRTEEPCVSVDDLEAMTTAVGASPKGPVG